MEGFKNVSLGNVLSSSYKGDKNVTFLSEQDKVINRSFTLLYTVHTTIPLTPVSPCLGSNLNACNVRLLY